MTILELSAAQIGDKIRSGELTSAEVTAFFIERIEKHKQVEDHYDDMGDDVSSITRAFNIGPTW